MLKLSTLIDQLFSVSLISEGSIVNFTKLPIASVTTFHGTLAICRLGSLFLVLSCGCLQTICQGNGTRRQLRDDLCLLEITPHSPPRLRPCLPSGSRVDVDGGSQHSPWREGEGTDSIHTSRHVAHTDLLPSLHLALRD